MAFEDLVEVRSRGPVAFVVRDCAAHLMQWLANGRVAKTG
jgi:hypothetical protein